MPCDPTMRRFRQVEEALSAAKQAVSDLEGARWMLREDPLTEAEGRDVNTLTASAEHQLNRATQILET